MFTETMLLQVRRFMVCLLVTAVTLSQADLKFSIDRTTDFIYCGHLQCLANYNEFDTRVLSIAELSIYDVIQVNLKVKLASVSMFDPNLFVEPGKVNVLNVTGSVSRYHGDLTLSLRDVTDCMYGTFTCELDFLDRNIKADVISDSLTPDLPVLENGTCGAMLGSQLSKMEAQIQTHSESVEAELAQIKTHSDSVQAELGQIKTQNRDMAVNLDIILDQLARLETSFNSSHDDLKVTCVKGMSHTCPREKFLLWGTIPALCDTETDGGGWVIIQRRTKGDVDLYRDWATYKKGFGTPDTDFWIGNDNIHNLTSQGYTELRIDMEFKEIGPFYAHYSSFSVADEVSKYKLSVSGFSGTGGDSMAVHNDIYFSTYDRDNDIDDGRHCAAVYRGGWWYINCRYSDLNGVWGATGEKGVVWFTGSRNKVATLTEMKVRHV